MAAPRGSIVPGLAPQNVWYHGTSEAGAAQIRRDGFINPAAGMGRATDAAHVFLARDPAEAAKYGPVVIPVRQEDIPVTPGSRPISQRGDVIAIGGGVPFVGNSQAIGDRPVTTMTNPLPGYRPMAMVNTPLAQQLRAMINHALAQRGLHPLINAPLPVGPTQMGRM